LGYGVTCGSNLAKDNKMIRYWKSSLDGKILMIYQHTTKDLYFFS